MSDSKSQCFVMQPFDRGKYDSLYEQVFEPAIRKADYEPYRVDNDPGASIPIETIEAEIGRSLACFGEITEDNPNVWFEVGYAIAREKPLCLVSSMGRTKFPFDVQHRKIITYPAHALPKDYEALGSEITDRLRALASREESRRKNAQAVSALAVIPETSGLAPHELLVLTLIFEDQYSSGTPAHSLQTAIKKSGYREVVANLAVTALIRKKYVEQREVEFEYGSERRFFVTELGEDWLIQNQHKLNLQLPSDVVRRASDDYATSTEITDDDIPF